MAHVRYDRVMVNERHPTDEREARIDKMMDEFRTARERRLAKLGIALWNRAEMEQRLIAFEAPLPSNKIN